MRENILSNKRPEIKFTDTGGRIEPQVIPPNSFINGDCMEFMRTCPPNYFDLAIVDPPYGIGESGTRGNPKSNKWKNPSPTIHKVKKWDASPPPQEYFDELKRVSKAQIIFGGNYFVKYLEPSMGWIFWDKQTGESDYSDGELAYTSFNRALRKFTWLWNGFRQAEIEKRIHFTQKPVALYKWILRNYAKAGDLILDTHVGSASSLIACVELGFDYVGFEIDKEYYTMAKSRLGRATRKYELFEAV